MKTSTTYLLYGALFGLLFPIVGTIIYCLDFYSSLSWDFVVAAQSDNLLLWIIDTAPVFLGGLAYIAGLKQQRINDINYNLGKKVQEQTQSLLAANVALRKEIEEGKIREKELIVAREEAEQGERSKDQFLSNMSHEIRTPMNGILGMTNILLETSLSESQRKYLSAIDYSAKNLLVIINDILDLSKINSEKLELEQTPFRITEVFGSVENTLKLKAEEKGISLSMLIDKRVPDTMIGDPVRVNQILLNLVGNAVKFTEKGGVDVSCRLVDTKDVRHEILIEVRDTGIGIPQEKLDLVFESFTQASTQVTRQYGGTGLGLPISKKLIELHGGELTVTSEPEKGSTFSFSLSFFAAPELEEVQPAPIESPIAPMTDTSKIEVLLVEDNDINQMVARNFLKRYGFKAETAKNGLEAIEKLKNRHFDIVLMDVQMPEMDGLEATVHIRKNFPSPKNKVKIMAMTASVLKKEIDNCMKAGMDDFIPKPFNPEDLYKKILHMVRDRHVA